MTDLLTTTRPDIVPGDEFSVDGDPKWYLAVATDDSGITHASGRIRWDAPGLRRMSRRGEITAAGSGALSPDEREELRTCEETVRTGRETFRRVGEALLTIRDKRLYRDTHRSFESYLQERWDLGRAYGYQLIKAAEVVQRLAPASAVLPTTESQARELARAPEEQQAEVWAEAVEAAPEGRVTAAQIREAVERRRQPDPEPEPEPADEPELSAIADTPAEPQPVLDPEPDYLGYRVGDSVQWIEDQTERVRRGQINNLWQGMLSVAPADGSGPQMVMLAPDRPGLEKLPPATPAADPKPASAPIKTAAEIAAERAAQRSAPSPASPAKKAGALKSAEEIVAEKAAARGEQPKAAPEGWDGKPIQAIIPAQLYDRLSAVRGAVLPAVRVYCELAELAGDYRLEPAACIGYLGRFLGYCRRVNRTPESVLAEADRAGWDDEDAAPESEQDAEEPADV